MGIITALKQQKNKNRVNVYMDGKYSFGIDLENLIKLNLKVEQELTENEIESIVAKAEYQKVFDKLVRFAMMRPRSLHEIKSWLKRKKVHVSLHEQLVEKITEYDLVDDEKFVRWWVEQRQQFRPRSKLHLQQELLQKGISKSLIAAVLTEHEINEERTAKNLITKKSYTWDKFDKITAKRKKSEFLARKGFSWEVIKEVVKEK